MSFEDPKCDRIPCHTDTWNKVDILRYSPFSSQTGPRKLLYTSGKTWKNIIQDDDEKIHFQIYSDDGMYILDVRNVKSSNVDYCTFYINGVIAAKGAVQGTKKLWFWEYNCELYAKEPRFIKYFYGGPDCNIIQQY